MKRYRLKFSNFDMTQEVLLGYFSSLDIIFPYFKKLQLSHLIFDQAYDLNELVNISQKKARNLKYSKAVMKNHSVG